MKKIIGMIASVLAIAAGIVLLSVSFRDIAVHAEPEAHVHCLCVGNATVANKHSFGHTCNNNQVWTPIGTTEEFMALAGNTSAPHVYLTADIVLTEALTLPQAKIFLCLNGHNITSSGRVFNLTGSTTSTDACRLYITDCNGDDCGTITGKSKESGGAVYATAGRVYLYNGKITAENKETTDPTGGVLYIKGISSSQKSYFYLLGGSVYGGVAKNGGNITMSSNSVFNMYGGEISGGSCPDWGANLHLSSGTATGTMYAGKIYGGNAGKYGANVQNGGSFTFGGGEIYGGVAGTYGGNINFEGSGTISGGSIYDGKAGTYGGNVSIKKTLTMSGGEISGGKAKTGGGNICVYGGTFNMKGGTVSGGAVNGTTEKFYGGNVYVFGTTLSGTDKDAVMNLSGGTVKDGIAYRGGNVYVDGFAGTCFNMSGGTLTGGIATNQGGNLGVRTGNIDMTGGLITDGVYRTTSDSKTHRTANIYASSDTCTFSFTGGEVAGHMNLPYNFKKLVLGGSFKCHNGSYGIYISNTSTDAKVQNICLEKMNADADILIETFDRGGNKNWTGSDDKTLFAGEVSDDFSEEDLQHINLASKIGSMLTLLPDRTVHISDEKTGCICGGHLTDGKTYGTGDYAVTHHCEIKTWTKWTSTTSLPTVESVNETPGEYYFYLADNVTLSASWNPSKKASGILTDMDGYHFVIDFNGKTVTTTSNSRFLTNYSNPDYADNIHLSFTDSKSGGGVTIKNKASHTSNSGSLFWMNSKAPDFIIDIYGGIFNGNEGTGTTMKGMINMGAAGSRVNFFDGDIICQITGTEDSSKSAGIYVEKGVFNMYGGVIRDGIGKSGSNVYLTGTASSFNMFGGKITGGASYQDANGFSGGNIYVGSGSTFNLYGGEVLDGKAYAGGNFYIYKGTLNIYGGEITGGASSTNGGNISMNLGLVNMEDGKVGPIAAGNTKSNIGISGLETVDGVKNYAEFRLSGGQVQSMLLIRGHAKISGGVLIGNAGTYQYEDADYEITGGYFRGNLTKNLEGTYVITGGHFVNRPEGDFITVPAPKKIFESSLEKDGVRYFYTVGEGINVALTSTGVREDGVLKTGESYALATLQGPGEISTGEPFTLEATAVSGYKFAGWYLDPAGDPVSTSATYRVEEGASEDTVYIAFYEPLEGEGYLFKVVTNPIGAFTYTVLKGKTSLTTGYDFVTGAKVPCGTEIGITHNNAETFLGWFNATEKLVSASEDYSFRIGADTEIHASYEETEKVYAVFLTDYQQLIGFENLSDLESLKELPLRVGQTVNGWAYNGKIYEASAAGLEALKADLSAQEFTDGTITLTASYTPEEETFTLKLQLVKVDNAENWDGWSNVGTAEVITDSAKAAFSTSLSLDGRTVPAYKFLGFTDVEGGNLLTTGETLVYKPERDTTVFAVFGPNEAVKLPMISWQLLKVLDQGTETPSYTYSATALRSVPEPFVQLEQGILIATGALVSDATDALTVLTLDNTSVSKFISSNQSPAGTTSLNIKNLNDNTTVYLRGYVIYLDNAGNRGIAYTDVAYGTGEGPMETTTPAPSFDDEDFIGLILESPVGVTVALYQGTTTTEGVDATETKIRNGLKRTYYKALPAGNYVYKASGSGYYTATTVVTMEQSQTTTQYIVTADPGKKLGLPYEAKSVERFNEKLMQNAFNPDPEQWPDYAYAFESPYFQRESYEYGLNCTTSHEEMMEFIDSLEDGVHVKNYYFGTSPVHKLDMEVLVVTDSDLSAANTYEEAGAVLRSNGKLNVQIVTGMHGNEPASAEAGLSIIKMLCGPDGAEYRDKMNFIFIPRLNPDGSYEYVRKNIANDFDMNHDQLSSIASEVTDSHKVFRAFMPEAILDLHEFNSSKTTTGTQSYAEVLTGIGHIYSETALRDYAWAAVNDGIAALNSNHFTTKFYPADSLAMINAAKSRTGRGYYAEYGGISFLVESAGIGNDFSVYPRRVVAQCIMVQSILDYFLENPELKTMVSEVRERMLNHYGTYDPNRLIQLTTEASGSAAATHKGEQINFTTGKLNGTYATLSDYLLDRVVLERTIPTAYIVPADADGITDVLATLDKHGITYYRVSEGTEISVKQYKKLTDTTAELCAESSVMFVNGAYVFEMTQEGAHILALMMEPDSGRTGDYTFAIMGMLKADENNLYPIYRYEHNLDEMTWK